MKIAIILMGVAVVLLALIVTYLATKVYQLQKSIISMAVILQAKTNFTADNPADIVKRAFSHVDET